MAVLGSPSLISLFSYGLSADRRATLTELELNNITIQELCQTLSESVDSMTEVAVRMGTLMVPYGQWTSQSNTELLAEH